ncbi:threonine-phosphate decarboxylase [Jannaschia pohangensis]|uniref:Aminotransferase n=1 Tax=Jannaschia pohangensis TaxID=390807 RepID=A0A1I3M3M7_9RHOB|nr:threonine-phosphate decarboxylase [Jannaschia pohangensis]SFI91649.1 L-threonine O-3-phosphate decarboxylase [Jannaschia pohangensis]
MTKARDHGGNLDLARARYGGAPDDWIDLSTGINPVPYPLPDLPDRVWTALPDTRARADLIAVARRFWRIPSEAGVLPAPGASALIARLPTLAAGDRVHIPGPTYNEHAAAFRAHGFTVTDDTTAPSRVFVNPNNPDGREWCDAVLRPFAVIDESFCDVTFDRSQVALTTERGIIVLKSFGKFWGLAGLRLGFAIAHPDTLAPLAEALGPWAVSGPALTIGTAALGDEDWAEETRTRLSRDAMRLDDLMARHGTAVGGTDLFRLYDVGDAVSFRDRLARHRIWSRIFPYSKGWLRLGLPHPDHWPRLEEALG